MNLFELKKKDYKNIIILSSITFLLYFINNAYISAMVCIISMLLFYSKSNYGGCIASFILIGSLVSVSYLSVACISLLWLLLGIELKMHARQSSLLLALFTLAVMGISFFTGFQVEKSIFILAVLSLVLYTGIRNNSTKLVNSYIVCAYIAYGLIVILIVMVGIVLGKNTFLFGRLAFQNSIRSLANACVIPLFYILAAFISKEKLINIKKQWLIAICMVLLGGLIATISRGAIVALLVSVLVAFMFTKGLGSKYIKITVFGLLAVCIFLVLSQSTAFHFSHMFVDEEGGFNGRTSIWAHYWKMMKDGGITHILFGLGPGDIKRLAPDLNMYSHSTYFDIFFSYGVLGGIVMLTGLFIAAKKVFKSHSIILLASLSGLLVNYLTHGTVANFTAYIVLASIMGTVENIKTTEVFQEECTICISIGDGV